MREQGAALQIKAFYLSSGDTLRNIAVSSGLVSSYAGAVSFSAVIPPAEEGDCVAVTPEIGTGTGDEVVPDQREARKIAVFGGTFDPVHLGHVKIAELAQQALGLAEVRFVPCRISPHKTEQVAPVPGADRLEMLRRATAGLAWAVVDDCELRGDATSFSYATAEAMRERFPGTRLFWMMGGDQWDALPQWRHPQRLAACVEFIVFGRGGVPQPRAGYVMHVLAGSHPAAARAIRETIAHGQTSHPWLAPAVAEWIVRHRLYQAG